MSARILVVEDEPDLREAMVAALDADGHAVTAAADGNAAFEALADLPREVVLLDIGLGGGPDGIEVCRRLREIDADVYVMMLTARDDEADVVRALEAGADDYVTKPVGIAELRSRVRAALRRLAVAPPADDGDVLRHGPLTLEVRSHRVAVAGTLFAPTRTEYALLESLLRADGAVRSRNQLMQAIYGDDAYRDPRGVDVHVHHLREKLEQAGADPALLVTVRGVGYRLGP